MGIKITDIIAVLILNFVHCTHSENILSCNVTELGMCPGKYQKCNGTLNECQCFDGYYMDRGECIENNSDNFVSYDTTAAIISIFTISLVVVGLVLVIRKYSLLGYVRQKINLRRNNDVMYEDVMIGQDDPPLVP